MPVSLLGFTLAVVLAAPEQRPLQRVVVDRFEAVGRQAPTFDPALSKAAADLAERALSHGVEDATHLLRVSAALSRNGAWEPNPIVVALRAPADRLATELAKQDLGAEPSTHVGLGVAGDGDRAALIVLLARRRMELEPTARRHDSAPATTPVCGVIAPDLTHAELFVTLPSGTVERQPMHRAGERRCAMVAFKREGRHVVEVLAGGARGPEVAALFFVDVGPVQASNDEPLKEPQNDEQARAELLARINALRLSQGVTPVAVDTALEQVAQAWAERLARERFFSHVAPEGSTLQQRLNAAGIGYGVAGENLGLSSGPLSAHFGIEHSPGHRNNLLDPAHRRLGLGLARRSDGLLVLAEVLAAPGPSELRNPTGAVYEAIVTERARLELPQLRRHPVLDELAQAHVRAAIRADLPKASLPGAPKLHDRVFELVEAVQSVAVDVVIADNPRAFESKNLRLPSPGFVGIGCARADSEKYGVGRYWIVIIYGRTR